MKKLVFAAALLLTAGIGMNAQTVRKGMKDLRQDVQEKKEDKLQRDRALANGKLPAAAAKHNEVVSDNKAIAEDRRILKAKGVKHPERKAKRQLRRRK